MCATESLTCSKSELAELLLRLYPRYWPSALFYLVRKSDVAKACAETSRRRSAADDSISEESETSIDSFDEEDAIVVDELEI